MITKTNWQYDSVRFEVTGRDNGNCRITVAIPYGKDAEERDAIGTLIAAAPEMLEALKGCAKSISALLPMLNAEQREQVCDAIAECDERRVDAKAAIAKAGR